MTHKHVWIEKLNGWECDECGQGTYQREKPSETWCPACGINRAIHDRREETMFSLCKERDAALAKIKELTQVPEPDDLPLTFRHGSKVQVTHSGSFAVRCGDGSLLRITTIGPVTLEWGP